MRLFSDIKVGSNVIGTGHPPYLIAEIAWGHDGKLDVALTLLEKAKEAGAHAVGLHITHLESYMTEDYRCLDGQTLSNKDAEEKPATIYKYLQGADLSRNEYEQVFSRARELNLDLCLMCNDLPSLAWAQTFRPELYALPAAAFVEPLFIQAMAELGTPTVLRVGGATLGEIEEVVNAFRRASNPNIVILHGIQLYPTQLRDLNMAQLPALASMFGCHVGLADHIDGELEEAVALPPLAIPMGAVVLEKHFTDDRANKREDFEAALGTAEFKRFATIAASAQMAMGLDSFGDLSQGELRYRRVVRKKVVAAATIQEGETIRSEHLTCKRTDRGGDPRHMELFIGRKASRTIEPNTGVDITCLA